jgi:protein-S-isoprenylcysteine O-methyltransferase Ste14
VSVFVLARAVTYAVLFIGFFLVYLPARVLERAGIQAPPAVGPAQVIGGILTAAGVLLALACVLAFALAGRGTPAPFDPPRRLVVRGPYARVRNPMYLGAWLVLGGATLYFRSAALLLFALAFIAATVAFVHLYEEPALRRRFGAAYEAYRTAVGRWWPRRPVQGP